MARTEAVSDARRRRARFREQLGVNGLDGAIVTDSSNFTYLTGYLTPSTTNRSRPLALVVLADGAAYAVVSEAEGGRLVEWDDELDPLGYRDPSSSIASAVGPGYAAAVVDVIVGCLSRRRPQRLAIEESGPSLAGLPTAAVRALRERLSPAEFIDLDALIWPLRLLKTPFEVERMRAAASSLAHAFAAFSERARAGMTERDLHSEFAAAAARCGVEGLRYLVVVAGPDRPMLGPPFEHEWREGELLAVDACVQQNGYWADFCRHYAAVEPTPDQLRAYSRLVQSLEAGRDALRAGATAEASTVAMGAALGAGATEFGRLGHGIGLDLAEPPSLHASDRTRLEAGMTLCVEPSAEYESAGTLVAEEMVLVTDGGVELLSPAYPAELEVLA